MTCVGRSGISCCECFRTLACMQSLDVLIYMNTMMKAQHGITPSTKYSCWYRRLANRLRSVYSTLS